MSFPSQDSGSAPAPTRAILRPATFRGRASRLAASSWGTCRFPRAAAALSLALSTTLSAAAVTALSAEKAAGQSGTDGSAQSVAEVVAVVDLYHAALATGDSTTAISLLADDVVILESGGAEDKDHYRGGHLAGDIRFAAAVPRERSDVEVTILGDAAWAWSTNTVQGRMGDREVHSNGAELMVLSRENGAWVIRAIHWSSRAVR